MTSGRWSGWSTRSALGLCLLALIATPLPAVAQQQDESARRRQLEVFEELLAETVQRHVSVHIDRTVQIEKAAAEGEDISGMVVRASAAPRAHGTYIADYGVIFSIETPQVVVLPGALATRFEAPLVGGVYSFRTEEPFGRRTDWREASHLVEFRTQMIRQSLDELESLLEKERGADADSSRLEAMIADIARLKESLVELEAKAEAARPHEVSEDTDAGEIEPEPTELEIRVEGGDARVRTVRGFEFYRDVVKEQRQLAEILEQNRRELNSTVNEAAIEALAQYGSVIKGLGDDERVSVLVLPPSQFGPVRVRHALAEEYVLSVRYGDIRDLDNRKIDLEQFQERVRLHNRLGGEVVWTREPQE
jgi:hypothetical protein